MTAPEASVCDTNRFTGRTVAHGYTRPGRVGTVTYPNNQVVTRGYDAAGRWDAVTDWNAKTTSFNFDADGNVTGTAMPNGTSMTRSFDADDNMTQITLGFPAGGWPVTYTRGANDELLQASQLGGPNTWAYDPAQQVTATTNPTGTFSFDPAGNPTTLDGTHQSFNTSGEVCWTGSTSGACGSPPAGATTYGYDANGQRTSGGADTYTYHATGMMTGATTPTSTSSYTYAPNSLRTSKTVGTTSTVFSWDDTTPVPELIQDGNNYYVYGPDGLPVERVGADPTQWLMCDATGSVIGSTDATGSLTSVQSYDPWGNATIHTGSPVSLGWQGQYQDPETHLYYFQHRYYDPTTAQFTRPDPLYTLTRSRYSYAANDPVNGSDPTGLCGFLGNGPCTPGGIAKEATNDTIGVATGGHANCVRYATCSGSTENAYYSAGDVIDFAARNRGTIATGVATVGCLIPGVGWVSCAGLQAGAYGFRAQHRIADEGFGNSLGENAVDLAFATAFFAVGGLPEWFGSFKGMGPWSQEVVRLMEAGPDIMRSILEHCDG